MANLAFTLRNRKVLSGYPLQIKGLWNLSRKHFRVSLSEGRFVKLNHFENRLTARDLRFYCWKLKPRHVYFSVLNWLFPERVGKRARGDTVGVNAHGRGRPIGSGLKASWRGGVIWQASSPKLARLNNVPGVWELDIDEKGNFHLKVWEWK